MPKRIRLDAIRPATAELFLLLGKFPQLQGFTLIGGTAIALIIGHRLSNDLDFAFFGEKLPTKELDDLVSELRTGGLQVQIITDPSQISNFKIATGKRLLDFARDYMFGNTRVTFFAMGSKQTTAFVSHLKQASTLDTPGTSFNTLALDGLQVTKAVVLGQRVRSRDLYDLFVLTREHGYSVSQLLHDATSFGTNNDTEYYKAILRGEIPIDDDDEGLEPVGVSVSFNEIYTYFDAEISRIEVDEAARIARQF